MYIMITLGDNILNFLGPGFNWNASNVSSLRCSYTEVSFLFLEYIIHSHV